MEGAAAPGVEGGPSSPLALSSARPWHWLGGGPALQSSPLGHCHSGAMARGTEQSCRTFSPWQDMGRVPGDGGPVGLSPGDPLCIVKGFAPFS